MAPFCQRNKESAVYRGHKISRQVGQSKLVQAWEPSDQTHPGLLSSMKNGGQPVAWDLRQNYEVKISLQNILQFHFKNRFFKRTVI